MIPKIIHYCWFGKAPLPQIALQCIGSWKRHFQDYEIKEWNEDNFDVNMIPYTTEAYKAKKYAFVSDYARLWILYHYGGIYFDTDVEVIKPMDKILSKGAYMGCERDNYDKYPNVNPGLGFACEAKMDFYKELLELYEKNHFHVNGEYNLTTIVVRTTELLKRYGFKSKNEIQYIAGITIYPRIFFCPRAMETGKIKITKDSYTIHHYMASWMNPFSKFKSDLTLFAMNRPILAYLYTRIYSRVKKKMKR